MTFFEIAFVLLLLYFYFYPTMYSRKYRPDRHGTVFLLNLLLGWTVVVWIGLLIWIRLSYNRLARIEERGQRAHKEKMAALQRQMDQVHAEIDTPDGPDSAKMIEFLDLMAEKTANLFGPPTPEQRAETKRLDALNAARHATVTRCIDDATPDLLVQYLKRLRVDSAGHDDDSRGKAMLDDFIQQRLLPAVRAEHQVTEDDAASIADFARQAVGLDFELEADGETFAPLVDGGDVATAERHYREALTRYGWTVVKASRHRKGTATFTAERDGVRLLLQCRAQAAEYGEGAVEHALLDTVVAEATATAIISPGEPTPEAVRMAVARGVHLVHAVDARRLVASCYPLHGRPFDVERTAMVETREAAGRCAKVLAANGWLPSVSAPDEDDVVLIRATANGRAMVVACKCNNRGIHRPVVQFAADQASTVHATAVVVAHAERNFTRPTRDLALKLDVHLVAESELGEFAAKERRRGSRAATNRGA